VMPFFKLEPPPGMVKVTVVMRVATRI
jgi:hypothetical protein